MFNHVIKINPRFLTETLSTLYMTFVTAIIAGIIGLILGILLVTTQQNKILENRILHSLLDRAINLLRSIPFIILMAILASFTTFLVGTRIGERAAIVPLVFGTFPFFARQVENALVSVDDGIVEAALSMGNSTWDIIWGVYLREGLPNLVRAVALTLISLVSLTAMAGAIGAGGLGKLAISEGYNRYQDDVTFVALLIILVIVYVIQGIANIIIKKTTH